MLTHHITVDVLLHNSHEFPNKCPRDAHVGPTNFLFFFYYLILLISFPCIFKKKTNI